MSRDTEPNETVQMALGCLLLGCLHIIAGLGIFILGFIVGSIFGGYSFFVVWMAGLMGFLFWQLLYVIPLSIWLKRQGKSGMMKGVIIGAVITALLNGACFLLMR